MQANRAMWINEQVRVSDFGVEILHADYSKSLMGPALVCECTKCKERFHVEHAPLLGMHLTKCPKCDLKHTAFVEVEGWDL